MKKLIVYLCMLCSIGVGVGQTHAVCGANLYLTPRDNPLEAIVNMINSAKETIDIAAYSLTNETLVEAILAANKRGVKVRLYTDKIQSGGKAQKDIIKRFKQSKIQVKIKQSGVLMHLKLILVDGANPNTVRYSTASLNLSRNGFLQDNDLILYDPGCPLAARYVKAFDGFFKEP